MAEQSLSILFNTLEQARKTKVINNNFKLSELTMSQQRELLITVFDPLEAPAKLSNAFNKIIKDCVTSVDGTELTVLHRPFLIRELRDLSMGDTFTRTTNNDLNEEVKSDFKFNKIKYNKINKIKTSDEIIVNDCIKIVLSIPTLDHDTKINKTLIQNISSYRRNVEAKHESVDRGYVTSQYLLFETIKYVDKIIINDLEYIFKDLSISEQIKVINNLPQDYVTNITDFMKDVKSAENFSFEALNTKTKEQEIIEISYNIFSKEL